MGPLPLKYFDAPPLTDVNDSSHFLMNADATIRPHTDVDVPFTDVDAPPHHSQISMQITPTEVYALLQPLTDVDAPPTCPSHMAMPHPSRVSHDFE